MTIESSWGDDALAKNDPIGALVEYREAYAIKDDAALHIACGDILTTFDQDEKALNEYQLAQKLSPSSALDTKIADVRKKIQAASMPTRGGESEQMWATPDGADSFQIKTFDLIHAGKFDEALQFCNKQLQDDPARCALFRGQGNLSLSDESLR